MRAATWVSAWAKAMLCVVLAAALVPTLPHAAAVAEEGQPDAAAEGWAVASSHAGGDDGGVAADMRAADGGDSVEGGLAAAERAADDAAFFGSADDSERQVADATAQASADSDDAAQRAGGSQPVAGSPASGLSESETALVPMAEGESAGAEASQDGESGQGGSSSASEGSGEAGKAEGDDTGAAGKAGDAAGGDAKAGAAEGAADAGALDPAKLPNGTYTVSVSLRNASNLAQPSMASSAIDAVDSLSVQDGAYVLGLSVGTVQVGDIIGHVRQIDRFDAFSVTGTALSTEGEAVPAWTAKGESDGGPAAFPVPESAKADGYAAIQLHSDEMPVSPQKAALFIDWSTLQKVSDEPTSFDSDASGAQAAAGDPGDAGDAGAVAQEAGSTGAPGQAEAPAAQPAGAFAVGHVYSVPVAFTKAGTSETSMAAQYFGGTALVRPLADGAFDVRFSTNRPDYVESVSHDGAAARITSDGGSSREFAITVPRTEADATVRLDFVITPMKELGADSVSADMSLYYSRASDIGADAGQVSTSAPSSSSTGGGASMPGTGDSLGMAAAALGAVSLMAAMLVACMLYRRKQSMS